MLSIYFMYVLLLYKKFKIHYYPKKRLVLVDMENVVQENM